jgi:hypothetical protein
MKRYVCSEKPQGYLAVPAVDFERPLNAILRRLATLTLARDQTALLGRFPKRFSAAFWRYAIDFDRETRLQNLSLPRPKASKQLRGILWSHHGFKFDRQNNICVVIFCISPDGKRLTRLVWNHPNMPWIGTELRVGMIS